jgi:hypothetical protein
LVREPRELIPHLYRRTAPAAGEDIPEWFAFKSVVAVLREAIDAEAAAASGSESS